nr:hypothetical protein [Tanacetum cinerariifolium]
MVEVTLLTFKTSETCSRYALESQNVDYVYLLWEDLLYQVENKNSKKNNDMCYPRFTKVIIDYFMSKNQSISRRNKMFWHTARDDPMLNTIRVIFRHQDTQIYDAILPDVLTNQDMLDSKSYKEYYVVASGAVPPKAKTKYKKKADEPVTSPKSKTAFASKEAEQIKLATKSSKKDFHMSHASGSGDGVDIQSKGDSKDEDDNDVADDNDDDDGESDDHEDDSDDERTESDKKLDDENTMDDREDDEVIKELYDDVNVNLGNDDTKMTDANQGGSKQQNVSQESRFGQEEEDAHVTLTLVFDAQKAVEPVQSSFVSSDFTSKFLNLENPSLADNEIASLMETSAPHATVILEITSRFTTTTPPPPRSSILFYSNKHQLSQHQLSQQ